MHPGVVTGGHCGGAVAVTVGQDSDSHVAGRILVYIGPQPAQPQEVVLTTVSTGDRQVQGRITVVMSTGQKSSGQFVGLTQPLGVVVLVIVMHGVGVIRVCVIRVLELVLSIRVWVVSPRTLDEESRAMTRNRTEHMEVRDAIG